MFQPTANLGNPIREACRGWLGGVPNPRAGAWRSFFCAGSVVAAGGETKGWKGESFSDARETSARGRQRGTGRSIVFFDGNPRRCI